MTQQLEYIKELEQIINPSIIEKFKDWPTETKLYMYLHHLQIDMMAKYMEHLSKQISKQ